MDAAPQHPRDVAWPLAAMLLTQTAAAMTLAAVPVLAPEIARDAGIDASAVGAYTATLFGAATITSAASGGLIQRFGPVRTNQAALVFSSLALLLTTAARLPLIAASALLVGFGYGPNTPSGSHVLSRVTPPRMRGLVFSVKQSGAPLGGMLAGLILPWIAVAYGWRSAIAVASVLVLVAALAVQPLRARLDTGRGPPPGAVPSPLRAMRTVLEAVALRRLTAAAFVLMMVHACFQTFTVSFLVESAGLPLTAAGGLFAALSASASLSRVALGWLADRTGRAREVLVAVSLCAAGAAWLLASFSAAWSVPVQIAVCVLGGFGSAGWYGVFLAEVARHAPRAETGLATGGALFFVYSSIVAGPLLFAGAVAAAGSYPPALVAVGVLALAATANLLRMPR